MSKAHVKLNARRWARWRRAVFRLDGHRCVKCGRAGRLECDHIIPLDRGGDAWSMDNLQTLCRDCHIVKTSSENRKPESRERRRWRGGCCRPVQRWVREVEPGRGWVPRLHYQDEPYSHPDRWIIAKAKAVKMLRVVCQQARDRQRLIDGSAAGDQFLKGRGARLHVSSIAVEFEFYGSLQAGRSIHAQEFLRAA